MNKKVRILYILIVIIVLAIISLLIFTYMNMSDDVYKNDDIRNEDSEIWSYLKLEFYDKDDKLMDSPFNLEPFYLKFYDTKVDVCYNDGCHSTTYNKSGDTLIIDSTNFDYFSGIFSVSYKDDMMLLYDGNDGGNSILYYFSKPVG